MNNDSVNAVIYFYMWVAENQISVDDGLANLQSFPFLKHLNANKRLYLFIIYFLLCSRTGDGSVCRPLLLRAEGLVV